jgi:1-acyl-sn-glycerol-3-phosphate acyltransferase
MYFRRIEVTGQEHLPLGEPMLLAPTHRSRWDALMVAYAAGQDITGRDIRYMVSADEVTGLQGWFIRNLGGFPVDTKHPAIASLRYGVTLLQQGETLVIFPEGNIFRDAQVQPLKPGLARLALQAESSQAGLGIKVVPIYLRYSQPVPSWGCDVTVHVGRSLPVSKYGGGATKQSAQQLTTDLEAALKDLAAL